MRDGPVSEENVGRGSRRRAERNARNYGGREFSNVLADLKQRQKKVRKPCNSMLKCVIYDCSFHDSFSVDKIIVTMSVAD